MSNPLVTHFGATIDLGPCLAGRNLNLLAIRGYAPLETLAAISAPDVYDEYKNPKGTQRELDAKHSSESYEYAAGSADVLAQDDPRAFPEIILNARDAMVLEVYEHGNPEDLIDLNSFTPASEFDGGIVGVRIRAGDLEFPHPTASPQISRVDGNHRLSSVDLDALLAGELDEPVLVPFCLYVQLNTDQEIKLFRDINGTHKGMDVSFLITTAGRLGGDELKNDENTMHVWMASMLKGKGRAFEGVVFTGGSKAGAKEHLGKVPPIRIATLASTFKTMLASAQVMRSQFADNPDAVLELVDRYWKAVKSVFPEAWADRTNFILLQTIGLTGFARLGAVLIDQGINDGSVSQKDFEAYLKAVKESVDLSRKSEMWTGVAGAGGGKKVAEVVIAAATKSAAHKVKVLEDIQPANDPTASLD
jgi:DGQHR domain-containing protein